MKLLAVSLLALVAAGLLTAFAVRLLIDDHDMRRAVATPAPVRHEGEQWPTGMEGETW